MSVFLSFAAAVSPPSPAPVDTSVLPPSVLRVGHAGAVLFSPWVPTVLGLAALAVCALAGRRLWGRRRSRRATAADGGAAARRGWGAAVSAGSCVAAVLAVLLAVGAGVNAYAGYLPTPRAAARFLLGRSGAEADTVAASGSDVDQALLRSPGGAVAIAAGDTRWTLVKLRLSDPALRIRARAVLVALPPGYRSGQSRYRVLYLFSGYPGRASDWFVSGRITQTVDALAASGRFPYVIAVAPDVNGGFFSDSETLNAVGGAQVETWVTRDVVGYVDAHFRSEATRAGRVVAGMSSGGFAALNIALRHQDEFGESLAFEPYGDPGNVTRRLLGGKVSLLRANSPSAYAPSEPLHRVLPTFLDVGSGGDVAPVTALAAVLHARGEPVLTRVERGQRHTWSEATAGLPYALVFAARQWASAPLDPVFPESSFPVAGSDRYATTVSPDGQAEQAQQFACDRSIRAAGDGPGLVMAGCAVFDRACAGADVRALPARLTGARLTLACPPRGPGTAEDRRDSAG